MSITINSNMAASYSALNMKRANNNLTKSLQRLSSGKRITNPSDDAGGLAVGMKLQSALKRAAASRLNTQNGTSFLQMQDGVLKVAGEILDRMAELKSFWNDISKSDLDRETYNHEFVELQRELKMLKGQKFNGVSLFATREPDNNPLKVITSDDGLGEHIEMSRTGLFENFKSKFGADGELNTGSSGAKRQLIGEFTEDGGFLDSMPGYASRDYSKGQVVFKDGGGGTDSGYFMALTNINSGTFIQDTGTPTSQWIRIADEAGNGFAEAYPMAPDYDAQSIKYNADGDQVAYLAGDVVRVQAHWNSPTSSLWLRAQSDIPRGVDLSAIFAKDGNGDPTHVGANKLFGYVGADSMNGTKPTTEFISPNVEYAQPSMFNGTAANLMQIISSNAGNNNNPTFVKSGSNIYQPAFDWNLDQWISDSAIYGDSFFKDSTNQVLRMTSNVTGPYVGPDNYSAGQYVFGANNWQHVIHTATKDDMIHDPSNLSSFDASIAYSSNQAVINSENQVLQATSVMKGEFSNSQDYVAGDVVWEGSQFYEINNDFISNVSNWKSSDTYGANSIVKYNNAFYKTDGGEAQGTLPTAWAVSADMTNGTDSIDELNNAITAIGIGGADMIVTGAVTNETTGGNQSATGTYFRWSPFQKWDENATQTDIGDPTITNALGNTGVIDDTTRYTDVNDAKYWADTHYTGLDGTTVGTSYQYGDNIFYKGQHYVYVSHLSSDNPKYLAGGGATPGLTSMEKLIELKAALPLNMYIDTVGGGGNASMADGVHYKPNQELEFVDRLSDGRVRTSGAERRADSPVPPGDGIFNSVDDQFFGGLEAGNDGIYGTADDFYTATVDPNVALNGGHVDADADNNKELLDTSNTLADFSVADFVDFIQTLANVRAVNGGTMSRLSYAERILEENEINLGAAHSRIMDTDMAYESTKMARQNVLLQAAASMVTQANQLNAVVLSLLQ